ncbi:MULTISPECIES: TIGR04283 family arsenosugar biosynthesis glycosyltransferase [Fischerella]|uniref:TIGR04283 family arsenosugar biosynthesis glycosyltransferase n=1 Tax=Fischerella TaxID=1190 RepID=UPI0002E03CD9|nr:MULTISPECIES: TIGR04283 family arsenosugar biosynthesis glycosyltransferase [Fischerella]MBD2434923.1 TIGR04283 family arsenosugar biosynthesis glycosyltransferase [Fischerella sp. FACHB-380]
MTKFGETHQLPEIITQNIASATISIIIPTLNEAKNIKAALASTQPSTHVEIIVVDGGSQDETVTIAESFGVKVILAATGRAKQMNVGAAIANGEILLFLHADTCLPLGFDVMVREALAQPGVVAGAFALRIGAELPSLRVVEWGVNVRSRFLQMPYGDQAIFLTRKIFNHVGGFPELPIMEDFEIMRRLRSLGKITIIPVPIITSARRWLKKGIWQTTLMNQIVIIAYFLGISPQRIRSWYRQEKFKRF